MATRRQAKERGCKLDELDARMAEMMAKTIEEHLSVYFAEHATDALKRRQTEQGKTFKGAWEFVRSCWESCNEKHGDVGCVPDQVAFDLMMHYMETEAEGAKFVSLKEFEELERKERETRSARAKELWAKHDARIKIWSGKTTEEIKRMIELEKRPYLAHETPEQTEERRKREEARRVIAEKKAKAIAIQEAIKCQQMTFNF